MNVDSAAACVAYLTSMTSGWNDDATEQLVYEFERLEDADALSAATAKIARTWTSQGRVPLGVIIDAYHHEQRLAIEADRVAEKAAEVGCDGWGWTVEGQPCPVCNPALHRVFCDFELLRRWRDGVALFKLLDCADRAALESEYNRERCPKRVDFEHTSARPTQPTIDNEVF